MSIDSINSLNKWRDAVDKLDKSNQIRDALLKKLFTLQGSEFEIYDCLKSNDYLSNELVVLDLIREDKLPSKLVNLIIEDLKKTDDFKILLKLSSFLADNKAIEQKVLASIIDDDYQQHERAFEASLIGSELEIKVIEKIIDDYSVYELIYLLHYFNQTLFNTCYADERLLENWVSEDFKYPFILLNYDIILDQEYLKYSDLRRSIIDYLSNSLEANFQYFLLFSGILFERDIKQFRKKNSDLGLAEWALLEYRDNKTQWYEIDREPKQEKSSVSVNYSLNGEELISHYLEQTEAQEKNKAFWFLKWKVISGKDISVYDKRMADDERFMSYFNQLLDLNILNESRMDEIFKWPDVDYIRSYKKETDVKISFDSFSQESPLKLFGYSVGITSELEQSERRKILRKAFKEIDVAFFSYGWGTPGSPKRLHSISWHIARNIWRLKFQLNYEQAVKDWKSDLNFLKSEFYDNKMATEFIWPSP